MQHLAQVEVDEHDASDAARTTAIEKLKKYGIWEESDACVSTYELERKVRIERNALFMGKLGFTREAEKKKGGRPKTVLPKRPKTATEPSRRSSRTRTVAPRYTGETVDTSMAEAECDRTVHRDDGDDGDDGGDAGCSREGRRRGPRPRQTALALSEEERAAIGASAGPPSKWLPKFQVWLTKGDRYTNAASPAHARQSRRAPPEQKYSVSMGAPALRACGACDVHDPRTV